MEHLIYLDQNVLSDIRPRKLKQAQDDSFAIIFRVLRSPQVRLVYSFVHHTEISQISSPEYQQEHIELLEQLNTAFIEALTMELDYRRPSEIWAVHLENEDRNNVIGVSKCADYFSLLGRKLSGLPVDKSFEDVADQLKESLRPMLVSALNTLNDIDVSELSAEDMNNMEQLKKQLNEQLIQIESIKPLSIESHQKLGPKPFRDWDEIRQLNIESLSSGDVIPKIDDVFIGLNPDYRWSDYFSSSVHDQISRCYTLMNWAGYFADDFDSSKKGNDRFNASNNDMMHAQMASNCHFLISNDNAFRMKVKACYEHLNILTVVCSASEFIDKYCAVSDG